MFVFDVLKAHVSSQHLKFFFNSLNMVASVPHQCQICETSSKATKYLSIHVPQSGINVCSSHLVLFQSTG